MLSRSGKLMCNGGAKSVPEAKKRMRRYARLIQRLDYPVKLSNLRVVTMSAVHTTSHPLNLERVAKEINALYEPELFPAVMFKRYKIHFTCFSTGKVIVTGVKSTSQLETIVVPTMVELEIVI